MLEILNHVVLGALYRYTVFLSNSNPPIVFGNGVITEDIARAVENFFKAEGLDCDMEPDKNWKSRCSNNVEKELCERFNEGACVITQAEGSMRIHQKLGDKEIDGLRELSSHAHTKRIIVN